MYYKKRKDTSNVENYSLQIKNSLLRNIQNFDLYDGANKRRIEQIVEEGVTTENIEIVMWHIFNEYNDAYFEIKRLRDYNEVLRKVMKRNEKIFKQKLENTKN